MRNIYDVSEKQKRYFFNHVWGFTGERPYKPTYIRIVEDTDMDAYVIAFLEYDKGGQQYIFECDRFYFYSMSKDDANQIINAMTLSTLGLATLPDNHILPENKFLNIKERFEIIKHS